MSAAAASPDEPVPPPQDVDAIGREFARVYYDAFVAGTGAPPLESLHDDRSKYVFLRPGRLGDHAVEGAAAIGRFVERTHRRPAGCAVRVDSVDALRVRPGRLAVLTVGRLSRPERGEAGSSRTFVQSTMVEYWPSPSSARRFTVVGTVFKFDDDVVDDVPEDDAQWSAETPANLRFKPLQWDVAGGGGGDGGIGGGVGTTGSVGPGARAAGRLYVGGLSPAVTADDLSASFGRFGPVAEACVRRCAANNSKKKGGGDGASGQPSPRYFGIVRFENPATADAVAERGTVSLANGDRVIVEISIRHRTRGKTDPSRV